MGALQQRWRTEAPPPRPSPTSGRGSEASLESRSNSAMHAPLPPYRGHRFDSRQRPYTRAVRRVRTECRAGCDHFAGAALAAEARGVPADAVAAGQFAARGTGRRAVPGSFVPILSSGQRHRARRAVQSRLQHRRAGFFARAHARRRRVRRCRRQCRHLCHGAGAPCRRQWKSDRDRTASGDACAAGVQPCGVGLYAGEAGGGGGRRLPTAS